MNRKYDEIVDFWIVDTFICTPFSGNPAAVFVLDQMYSDEVLEKVAVEMGAFESVFVSPFMGQHGSMSFDAMDMSSMDEGNTGQVSLGCVYDLRWFSPKNELNFCAHGTLAAAHVLMSEYYSNFNYQAFFSETCSGVNKVIYSDGLITMSLPALQTSRVPMPDELLEGLGGTIPVYVGYSDHMYLVEFRSPKHVLSFRPDFSSLLALDARGVVVTSNYNYELEEKENGTCAYDYVSRFFEPAVGIAEVIVSASSHSLLAPYWGDRLDKSSFKAFHGSSKGREALIELRKIVYLLRNNR